MQLRRKFPIRKMMEYALQLLFPDSIASGANLKSNMKLRYNKYE